MTYTWDGVGLTLQFDSEGISTDPAYNWAYYAGLVTTETGADGTNPPLYVSLSNVVVNCSQLFFVDSHLVDSKKTIQIPTDYLAGPNTYRILIAGSSTFIDGELVNSATKQVRNGSVFVYYRTGAAGNNAYLVQTANSLNTSGYVYFYGTSFVSDVTANLFISGGTNRFYGASFNGVGINDSDEMGDTTQLTFKDASTYRWNSGEPIDSPTFIRSTDPFHWPLGTTLINNPTFISCTKTFRRIASSVDILDGTWIETPFSYAISSGTQSPTRSFSFSLSSNQADSRFYFEGGGTEIFNVLQAGLTYTDSSRHLYSTLDIASAISGEVLEADETVSGPWLFRVRKAGFFSVERDVNPKDQSTNAFGQTVISVGPVSERVTLLANSFIDNPGFTSSSITVDHASQEINLTGDLTLQEIANAIDTDSASELGIQHPTHWSWNSLIFETSYTLHLNGGIPTTGTWNIPSSGIINLEPGIYNLSLFTFASGSTFNLDSGTATVTVASDPGIVTTGAGTINVQVPQPTLSLTGFPDGSTVILSQAGVELDTLNNATSPYTYTVGSGGETGTTYQFKVVASGKQDFFVTIDSTETTSAPYLGLDEASEQVLSKPSLDFRELMGADATYQRIAGSDTTLNSQLWEITSWQSEWNTAVVADSPAVGEIAIWIGYLSTTGYDNISFNASTGEVS